MYDIKFRKLALRMLNCNGVMKTAQFTGVSRTTLWRWKRFGVQPRRRKACASPLFASVRDLLCAFMAANPCTHATGIKHYIKAVHDIDLSAKTVYKYLRLCRYSRKRSQWRGQSNRPADWEAQKQVFLQTYRGALDQDTPIVSFDECGFSQRVKPVYGYSPVGTPLVLKTRGGGWTHHSLLLAISSDGSKAFTVLAGAAKRADVSSFLNSIVRSGQHTIVLDNASIHKRIPPQSPLARFCFTPPYSPEFNAVELCFATIKRRFRALNVGASFTNVPDLVTQCVNTLQPRDIQACFRHVEGLVRLALPQSA